MTTSDFPKAAARISEGFCPLCDGQLDERATCAACDVAWALQGAASAMADDVTIFDTAGVLIVPSRRLTPDEIKRLYARPSAAP